MKRLLKTLRYTYSGSRGSILSWGLGLAFFGLLIVSMYETFAAMGGEFQQMISSYPPEFLAFFGATTDSMLTPVGFLKMYAFSMLPIIVGIFAVLAGSGLIVSDEEHGRLDLIIAHPIGRSAFFFGRLLGLLAATLSIHLLGWLGFSLLLGGSSLGLTWGQMALPFLTLLVQIVFYIALTLLLSMLLPSRNLAAVVSGAVMVTSYFITSLAFMDERVEILAKLMPYAYFQTVLSFRELNLNWLLALLGISTVMVAAAWLRFFRRDIRLSGEGSWRIPFTAKRSTQEPLGPGPIA
jgi:ABC-2 type transport system permease protein